MTYTPKILTGRCRTGSEKGGAVAHAVAGTSEFATALCGARPGRLSNGWSEWKPDKVTCPKCLKKMEQVTP